MRRTAGLLLLPLLAACNRPPEYVGPAPAGAINCALSEAIDLTRRVDPEGEWVMAAASATNPGANFSIVDSSRLERVATWPPTWSPERDVAQVVDEISPGVVVPTVTGTKLSLTIDNRAGMEKGLSVEVR